MDAFSLLQPYNKRSLYVCQYFISKIFGIFTKQYKHLVFTLDALSIIIQ